MNIDNYFKDWQPWRSCHLVESSLKIQSFLQILASLKIKERLPPFDGSIVDLMLMEYWNCDIYVYLIPSFSSSKELCEEVCHDILIDCVVYSVYLSSVCLSRVCHNYCLCRVCYSNFNRPEISFVFIMYIICYSLCLGFVMSSVCLSRVCHV